MKDHPDFLSIFGFVGFVLFLASVGIRAASIEEIEARIEGKIVKKECKSCNRLERIHPEIPYSEIPYCETCMEKAWDKSEELIKEAEKRIELIKKCRLEGQARGAKEWLRENLPDPIKWLFQQAILSNLKKIFPQAQFFDPNKHFFVQHPLDSDDPSVNIPSEGLEVLEVLDRLELIGGENYDRLN